MALQNKNSQIVDQFKIVELLKNKKPSELSKKTGLSKKKEISKTSEKKAKVKKKTDIFDFYQYVDGGNLTRDIALKYIIEGESDF